MKNLCFKSTKRHRSLWRFPKRHRSQSPSPIPYCMGWERDLHILPCISNIEQPAYVLYVPKINSKSNLTPTDVTEWHPSRHSFPRPRTLPFYTVQLPDRKTLICIPLEKPKAMRHPDTYRICDSPIYGFVLWPGVEQPYLQKYVRRRYRQPTLNIKQPRGSQSTCKWVRGQDYSIITF